MPSALRTVITRRRHVNRVWIPIAGFLCDQGALPSVTMTQAGFLSDQVFATREVEIRLAVIVVRMCQRDEKLVWSMWAIFEGERQLGR